MKTPENESARAQLRQAPPTGQHTFALPPEKSRKPCPITMATEFALPRMAVETTQIAMPNDGSPEGTNEPCHGNSAAAGAIAGTGPNTSSSPKTPGFIERVQARVRPDELYREEIVRSIFGEVGTPVEGEGCQRADALEHNEKPTPKGISKHGPRGVLHLENGGLLFRFQAGLVQAGFLIQHRAAQIPRLVGVRV